MTEITDKLDWHHKYVLLITFPRIGTTVIIIT
jgi:hypothetical protein